MKVLKKSLSVLLNIIICFIIVVATVFVIGAVSAKQNGGVPSVFGYSPVVVLSQSMEGKNKDSFFKDDLLVIGKTDTSKLKVNDVISFWDFIGGKKQLNTHRIVKIDKNGEDIRFITKGDNNPEADVDTRSPSDIVGVYQFKITGAGNFVKFLGSKWGFLFCLVLPLFLFFIWRLIKLVMAVVEYKNVKSEDKALEVKENETAEPTVAEPIAVKETPKEDAAEPDVAETEEVTDEAAEEPEKIEEPEAADQAETTETDSSDSDK